MSVTQERNTRALPRTRAVCVGLSEVKKVFPAILLYNLNTVEQNLVSSRLGYNSRAAQSANTQQHDTGTESTTNSQDAQDRVG